MSINNKATSLCLSKPMPRFSLGPNNQTLASIVAGSGYDNRRCFFAEMTAFRFAPSMKSTTKGRLAIDVVEKAPEYARAWETDFTMSCNADSDAPSFSLNMRKSVN